VVPFSTTETPGTYSSGPDLTVPEMTRSWAKEVQDKRQRTQSRRAGILGRLLCKNVSIG